MASGTQSYVIPGPADQYNPDISGDHVVWVEQCLNSNCALKAHDLSTGTTRVLSNTVRHGAPQDRPAVSGSRVVWTDWRRGGGTADVYVYDLSAPPDAAERLIAPGSQPDIAGDRIVWADMRNGQPNIYAYDLSTGVERRVTTDRGVEPAISGTKVVWRDERHGQAEIYAHDLATGAETRVTDHPDSQCDPSISGSRVVWIDGCGGGGTGVHVSDLASGVTIELATAGVSTDYPQIDGDRVVWRDARNGLDYDVYGYDFATGTEALIAGGPGNQLNPSVSGNRVVWSNAARTPNAIAAFTFGSGEGTPTGSNVAVTPLDPTSGTSPVSLTFGTVTSSGTSTVTTSSVGAPPPSGFRLGNPPTYYEVSTTAAFTGSATVCINYDPSGFKRESELRLFHGGSGEWTDVTTSLNTATHTVCGQVTSFSPFLVAEAFRYDFAGFLQPVDNTPVVNKMRAGAAIPVRFGLGGDQGLGIFLDGYPGSYPVSCATGLKTDAVEETVSASASGLTYAAATGNYTYTWKTASGWAGTCRKLTLGLNDGSAREVLFQFTR